MDNFAVDGEGDPRRHSPIAENAGTQSSGGPDGARVLGAAGAVLWLRSAVRWSEWYASKIPFVWTACGSAAFASAYSDLVVLQRTVGVILFTCLCGAFGHLANDYADRDCDRLVGRLSVIAQLGTGRARLLLLLVGGSILMILAAADFSLSTEMAGATTLFLAAAYSLPPLRLKEKGALGLWSAAAAQRTMPVLMAFGALGVWDIQACGVAAVAQLAGIRWMLVHQLADAENDRRAGIATYVRMVGQARARWILRRVVLPLELLAVLLALGAQSVSTPAVWTGAVAEALAIGVWIFLRRGVRRAYSLDGYLNQPLASFYQLVWPVTILLVLSVSRPGLCPLVMAFLVWESAFIRRRFADVVCSLRDRIHPRKPLGIVCDP